MSYEDSGYYDSGDYEGWLASPDARNPPVVAAPVVTAALPVTTAANPATRSVAALPVTTATTTQATPAATYEYDNNGEYSPGGGYDVQGNASPAQAALDAQWQQDYLNHTGQWAPTGQAAIDTGMSWAAPVVQAAAPVVTAASNTPSIVNGVLTIPDALKDNVYAQDAVSRFAYAQTVQDHYSNLDSPAAAAYGKQQADISSAAALAAYSLSQNYTPEAYKSYSELVSGDPIKAQAAYEQMKSAWAAEPQHQHDSGFGWLLPVAAIAAAIFAPELLGMLGEAGVGTVAATDIAAPTLFNAAADSALASTQLGLTAADVAGAAGASAAVPATSSSLLSTIGNLPTTIGNVLTPVGTDPLLVNAVGSGALNTGTSLAKGNDLETALGQGAVGALTGAANTYLTNEATQALAPVLQGSGVNPADAVNLAKSAITNNPAGMVTAGINIAGSELGNLGITNPTDITAKDVSGTINAVQGVQSGNIAQVLNGASALTNSPDLNTAAKAVTLIKAIETGNPLAIAGAASGLDKAVSAAPGTTTRGLATPSDTGGLPVAPTEPWVAPDASTVFGNLPTTPEAPVTPAEVVAAAESPLPVTPAEVAPVTPAEVVAAAPSLYPSIDELLNAPALTPDMTAADASASAPGGLPTDTPTAMSDWPNAEVTALNTVGGVDPVTGKVTFGQSDTPITPGPDIRVAPDLNPVVISAPRELPVAPVEPWVEPNPETVFGPLDEFSNVGIVDNGIGYSGPSAPGANSGDNAAVTGPSTSDTVVGPQNPPDVPVAEQPSPLPVEAPVEPPVEPPPTEQTPIVDDSFIAAFSAAKDAGATDTQAADTAAAISQTPAVVDNGALPVGTDIGTPVVGPATGTPVGVGSDASGVPGGVTGGLPGGTVGGTGDTPTAGVPVTETPPPEAPLLPLEPIVIPPSTPIPEVVVPPVVVTPTVTPKVTIAPKVTTPTSTTTSKGALPTVTDPTGIAGKVLTLGQLGKEMAYDEKLKQLTVPTSKEYAYAADDPLSNVDVYKALMAANAPAVGGASPVSPYATAMAQQNPYDTSQYSQYFAEGGQPDDTQSEKTTARDYGNADIMDALKNLGNIGSGLKPLGPKVFALGQVGSPSQAKALQQMNVIPQLAALLQSRGMRLAEGGSTDHQHPEYDGTPVFRSGGLDGLGGKYVEGKGDGTSDDITAMLANGEYVFSADVVSALGNGSNKAGAAELDHMVQAIRSRARSAPPDKLPPDAKAPLEYLKSKKGAK